MITTDEPFFSQQELPPGTGVVLSSYRTDLIPGMKVKTTVDVVDTLGRTVKRDSELFIKNVSGCTFRVENDKLKIKSSVTSYQCSIDGGERLFWLFE